MAVAAADDPVVLDDKKLEKLAKVVYNQEAEAAKHCKCNSEIERSYCIRETKVCYNTVLGLLESVRELKKEYENGDKDLSSIADHIYSFVVYASNFALQFVSNYSLRRHYLNKISEKAGALKTALGNIKPQVVNHKYVERVRRLATDASMFRNAMLDYVRVQSRPVSANFAKVLKETGLSFGKLVRRYKNKLGFQGAFRKLEAVKKLRVYNSIIEASGRGRVTVNVGAKVQGVIGTSALIFTAAKTVWDVYTSDNKLQTAARDAFLIIGAAGGGTLGEYAGVALGTGLLGAAASPLFLLAAGIVGGFFGAYILGNFAVRVVDHVFGWGDTDNINHLKDEMHLHRCCAAPAPQGFALARPIARFASAGPIAPHDEL